MRHQKMRTEMKEQLLKHIKTKKNLEIVKAVVGSGPRFWYPGSTSISLSARALQRLSRFLHSSRGQLKYSTFEPKRENESQSINNKDDSMTCRDERASFNHAFEKESGEKDRRPCSAKTRVRKRGAVLVRKIGWLVFILSHVYVERRRERSFSL